MSSNTVLSIEDFNQIINSKISGWYPPERPDVSFTWAKEQSGVYKGAPYFKPAGILIKIQSENFLIQKIENQLHVTQKASHLYAPGISLKDQDLMKTLKENLNVLIGFMAEQNKPKPIDRPAISQQNLNSFWDSFADCILQKIPAQLKTQVQKAIEQPVEYYNSHQKQFSERGIDEPVGDIYKFVLIDGLIEKNILAEIDWNTEPQEVKGSLEQISKNFTFDIQDLKRNHDTKKTLSFLAKQLEKQDLKIVTWEIDSDSYVIMVAKKEAQKSFQTAAKKIGLQIKVLK